MPSLTDVVPHRRRRRHRKRSSTAFALTLVSRTSARITRWCSPQLRRSSASIRTSYYRIADRLGVPAAALIRQTARPRRPPLDFDENGSVARRYQMQSDYWAPVRALCNQFSSACRSSSDGSVIAHIFSEGSQWI